MFSIVIPYYKKRKYIERCIDAVLAQTFSDYEIILVDDGSNDDIADVVNEKYSGKVKLIAQQNQGVSAARNMGIANATHEYIAFLDADDWWGVDYLEVATQVVLREGEVQMLGTNYSRTNTEIVNSKFLLKYRLIQNYFEKQVFKNTLFTSSSSIINAKFFKNHQGFNSKIKRGEDLDVWFRTIASGGKIVFIENVLVYYSDEDENQATNNTFDFKYSLLSIMAQEYLKKDSPVTLKQFTPTFIRKRIYSYFFNSNNHENAKGILKKIGYGNLFSNILYHLPFSLGKKISQTKYIRYYSKYLIK